MCSKKEGREDPMPRRGELGVIEKHQNIQDE